MVLVLKNKLLELRKELVYTGLDCCTQYALLCLTKPLLFPYSHSMLGLKINPDFLNPVLKKPLII